MIVHVALLLLQVALLLLLEDLQEQSNSLTVWLCTEKAYVGVVIVHGAREPPGRDTR